MKKSKNKTPKTFANKVEDNLGQGSCKMIRDSKLFTLSLAKKLG
jgi:hypothetical protein